MKVDTMYSELSRIIDTHLKELEYSVPFTEEDITDAYTLGAVAALHLLVDNMGLLSINSVAVPAATATEVNMLLDKLVEE